MLSPDCTPSWWPIFYYLVTNFWPFCDCHIWILSSRRIKDFIKSNRCSRHHQIQRLHLHFQHHSSLQVAHNQNKNAQMLYVEIRKPVIPSELEVTLLTWFTLLTCWHVDMGDEVCEGDEGYERDEGGQYGKDWLKQPLESARTRVSRSIFNLTVVI